MNAILIPAVIVAAIGLIAGIILTIASKLMFVPVDEKVAAIREILPGANCGGCGYAGCDDYAAAFADDPNLSTTLCPVGGADCAIAIAGILGVEAGDVDPQAAMVMCTGNHHVRRIIMSPDRLTTCKDAKMFYGGKWACAHGCLGMGDCFYACNYDAIEYDQGIAKVNPDKCIGCGACAKVCPQNIIAMVSKKKLVHVKCSSTDKGAATRKVCENGCIGCMKCQKSCKFEAIKIENNLASIDYAACKNCGLCAMECPTGAIANLRKKAAKPAAKPEDKPAAPAAEAKAPEEAKAE